jgi:hypothetical protein
MGGANLFFDSDDHVFNLLGFAVEFSKIGLQHLVGLLHGLEGGQSVSSLERDQPVSILGLGSSCVVQTVLHLEENEHVPEVLFAFQIVDVLQVHCVVVVALHLFEVVVQDELHPNLADLAVNRAGVRRIALLLVEIAKVIVAGAHQGGLGLLELREQVDAFSQLLQRFLIVALSRKEKSPEVHLKVGPVTVDLIVIDESIFVFRVGTALVIIVTGVLEQVPVCGNQEFFSLLES